MLGRTLCLMCLKRLQQSVNCNDIDNEFHFRFAVQKVTHKRHKRRLNLLFFCEDRQCCNYHKGDSMEED